VPQYAHRESEPGRLQREADDYTKNVEKSKKKLLRADDSAKNRIKEVEHVENNIKEMIPSEEEVHREAVKRSQLINRVAHRKVLLNRTYGINTAMIHEINSMRREIMFAQNAIETMKTKIADCKKVSLSSHKISTVLEYKSNETNNKILSLKHTTAQN
jgi:hypothetical protein